MKKDLTDKEKEERMNYLTIHKCKNEDEGRGVVGGSQSGKESTP